MEKGRGGREKLLKRELKLRAAEETETIRKFEVLQAVNQSVQAGVTV